VKEKFISTAATLIGDSLPGIEVIYETEYLDQLTEELTKILADKTCHSRREIPERKKQCRAEILKTVHEKFKIEKLFWKKHLAIALNEPSSEFKIQRFPETKVVMDYSDSLVEKCHQEITKSLENLLNLHFDQPTGLVTTVPVPIPVAPGTVPTSRSFTLTFSPTLVHLIVEASSTLSSFAPSNFASESIRRLFEHSPFIEKQRQKRYDVQQKLCLLDIALTDLRELGGKALQYRESKLLKEGSDPLEGGLDMFGGDGGGGGDY
jgi:hypothetical protein